MKCPPRLGRLTALLVLSLTAPLARAADWPTARHDAQRSNASTEELAATLHLHWSRQLPPLQPAWPDQPTLHFDVAYSPIVAGGTLFLASPREDSVTALDAATGVEKWKFLADAPVRFAPLAWENRLFFCSDDGYLYCLDQARGKLLWKFRGGPSDRKILGNERLISTWPARGAPVLVDGKIYFTAGIWPFMGIFIHALDARTGNELWTNDGDGAMYIPQPHNVDSFAGIAPQGYLAALGDKLLIPGGRTVPACYDRATGKLVYYRLADCSGMGGWQVSVLGPVFCNSEHLFNLKDGQQLDSIGEPVLTPEAIYAYAKGEIRAYAAPDESTGKVKLLDSVAAPAVETFIKSGSRLYLGGAGRLFALDLPLKGKISWESTLEGTAANIVSADGRLFVVTREGRLHCFGAAEKKAVIHETRAPAAPVADGWAAKAKELLDGTGVRDGYCLALGAGSGRLVAELARQSKLRLIVVEPDAARVESYRRELIEAGLCGTRISVLPGTPETLQLPPYFAELAVSEDLAAAKMTTDKGLLAKLYSSLRPYGGTAWLPIVAEKRKAFREQVALGNLQNASVKENGDWLCLVREGALPGAADWAHEHADAANTRFSRDKLVKAPLGILWFGGADHEGMLPRHGHGPQPQVCAGRMLMEGVDSLRATDIYTGRMLWEAKLPGLGEAFDKVYHQAGANGSGSNFVSTPDAIYVLLDKKCLVLDPATGKIKTEFPAPPLTGATGEGVWCYLNVSQDYLVGGINSTTDTLKLHYSALSSSSHLVVLNRHTGKLLWSAAARFSFRHNAICLGNDHLFCIDRPSEDMSSYLKRHGEGAKASSRLCAFELGNGKETWSTEENVFGTWLSYSTEHDVLVEAGRVARDTLDEPHGMRAYRADKGTVLWHKPAYDGPAMIGHETIFKNTGACDLLTGAPICKTNPMTGAMEEWSWGRGYGCNTPLVSENLLTFRSGAAGFYDLCHDGGTGNLGGFRSSCTNNLIVAGGVLVAPEYTRTCTCSYQNQTSLAVINMPEAELWTTFGAKTSSERVKSVGINFGATGDRRADDGTVWLEYPSVGGPSPIVPVKTVPERPEFFRHHSSSVSGPDMPWVAASGVKGLTSVTLTLDKDGAKERLYTVRLHFQDPDDLKAGQRIFDVSIQGKEVLKDFDVIREAGGSDRGLVKEFTGIRVAGKLTIDLRPSSRATVSETVLSGIEVKAQD